MLDCHVTLYTVYRQPLITRPTVIKVNARQQTMTISQSTGGLLKNYTGSSCIVQPQAESGNNGDIVTFTHSTDLKIHRHALSNPHTPTQLYVHKVMRTSSIQPAVVCTRVNIMHKTYKISSGSVQTRLDMGVLSGSENCCWPLV